VQPALSGRLSADAVTAPSQAAALLAVALLLVRAPVSAGEVVAGFGIDDVFWRDSVTTSLLLEYRADPIWAVGPVSLAPGGALEADRDGDVWAGGGLVGRLPLGGGRWRVTASGMIGAYRRGEDGTDLGRSVPIFRSQLELSREVTANWRAGLAWSHKSNAYTRPRNPGVETLYLTLNRTF
jgi:hypothetical protein